MPIEDNELIGVGEVEVEVEVEIETDAVHHVIVLEDDSEIVEEIDHLIKEENPEIEEEV